MAKDDFLIQVGNNIRQIRKEKDMNLTELGYKCGIEKSNLIPIEKGRINVTLLTLRRIADALDVEVKDFLDGNEPSDKPLR